jgi:basic membrane protein A and related proteins
MSGKFALIIGNTDYIDSGLARLTAPGKDAEDFARVLKDPEICAFDDVKVLLNQPESIARGVIDEFFDEKKPDDLLLFYFSGHGIKDEFNALYLAFANTTRARLRSTAIKSDYIREAMDQSRSRRQVAILDCCNSGAFPQGTKASPGGTMGIVSAFQGRGRFVLTASDSTQFAWEGDQVVGDTQNSLFTHFLLQGLEGEADNNGDGIITVDELYDYAHDHIAHLTPKQTPTKSVSVQEGEIVLRQFTHIEDIKPVALPDDLIGEMDDIRPLVREGAVQRLVKILNGKNIGLRRSAIEALEKIIADENTTRRVAQLATQALDAYHQVEQKAEAERKAREEAERFAFLKAEEERLAREKALAERKAREETEKLARAQAARESAEREAMRLKAEREATEKAAKEAAEKAEKEKAEKEIAEREAARLAAERKAASEKAEREAVLKAEREAIELASRKKAEREQAEKEEREALELAARRKAEREAVEQAAPKIVNSSRKATKKTGSIPSLLKWTVLGVIGVCVLVGGIFYITYTPPLDCKDEKTFCVGLVTDVGRVNDMSFNQSAWEGVQRAEQELGAVVNYIETSDSQDYDKNIATFADEGYDVIVTVGFGMTEATDKAAGIYPNIKFIGVDQSQYTDVAGVVGLNFPEDNAGFLVGALAAMVSKTNHIGAVCGTDAVPPVWRFGEGYRAGAAYADGLKGTSTTVDVVYHNDVGFDRTFTDPEWGAATANAMMEQGADAIFGCGGITGNGAITAAAQAGKYAIGVDTDQYLTLPEAAPRLLTSAMKLITPGVFDLISKAKDGQFPVGNYYGNAGYAPFHDLESEVSQEVKSLMERIDIGLQSGTIQTNVPAAKP